MTEKKLDRVIAVLLTTAILVGAIVLVDARFGLFQKDASRPDPRAPDFVPRWREMLTMGIRVGDATAPVQVIEFLDLECPACRELHPIIKEIRRRFGDDLAVTYIMTPLPYHRHAESAARAAVCADQQGVGGAFVDVAYAGSAIISQRPWAGFGSESGIADSQAFARCVNDTSAVALIESGKQLSDSIDITGTPTLIVNGWRFESGVPSQTFLIRFIQDLKNGKLPGDTISNVAPIRPTVSRESSVDVYHHLPEGIAKAPKLRLSYSPVTVLRSPSSRLDFDLTGLRRAAMLRDGSVVVSVGGARSRVLLFDRDGQPSRVLARWGEGPGELRYVSGLAVLPMM